MEKKEGYIEFITSESYKHQIDIWFKANNIFSEKIELFYDFLTSLYEVVDETYLGTDVLNYESDQKNHFKWCWNKIINNLEKENIHFKDKGNHYEYFWNFFLEAYYLMKIDDSAIKIPEYFYILFNFNHKKSRSELDMLTEIYKMLEQNLKK
jgi:hypothetical protein